LTGAIGAHRIQPILTAGWTKQPVSEGRGLELQAGVESGATEEFYSGDEAEAAGVPLGWRVWLARERPGRAAAGAAVVLVATAVVRAVTGEPAWAVLTFALLMLTVRDFALPLRFTLTEGYAEVRGLWLCQRIEWERVRAVRRDREGLKLSPLGGRSRLEAYRGVYLWLPPGEGERVAAVVRQMARRGTQG